MSGHKRVATFVILKNEDKFLLLKRAKEPHKDKYVPVGGKIEPYETPQESAVRETYEETGILLQDIHYCGTLTETSPTDYNWVSFVYAAEIPYKEAPLCNEGILQWIDYKDIHTIPSPMTDIFIFELIREKRKFALNAIYNESLDLQSIKDDLTNTILYLKK